MMSLALLSLLPLLLEAQVDTGIALSITTPSTIDVCVPATDLVITGGTSPYTLNIYEGADATGTPLESFTIASPGAVAWIDDVAEVGTTLSFAVTDFAGLTETSGTVVVVATTVETVSACPNANTALSSAVTSSDVATSTSSSTDTEATSTSTSTSSSDSGSTSGTPTSTTTQSPGASQSKAPNVFVNAATSITPRLYNQVAALTAVAGFAMFIL